MDEKANMKDLMSGCIQRQKYWNELTADEKIERMRNEVRNLKNRLKEADMLARSALTILENHEHLNGKIVTSIETNLQKHIGSCEDKHFGDGNGKDEVYF